MVKNPSHLESQFASIWQYTYPQIDLEAEYVPARPRKYRIDFADADRKIGIEIQGGIWSRRSGHTGGSGVTSDAEKFCFLAAIGWRIFPLIDKHLTIGSPQLALIARAIEDSPKCAGYSDAQVATIVGWDSVDRVIACRANVKSKDRSRLARYWVFDETYDRWHPRIRHL